MDSNTPQFCRLCLKNSEDSVNIFKNFEGTTIASILTQHFWFQVHEDDGFSEHLCKICWTNTKMFHCFYRKVELIQENYWKTINLIKTDIDVVEQDQNVSPNGTVMKIDLSIIKCEETEQVTDLQINIAESSHHNENNFHLNDSVDCENKHILEDEGEFSKPKPNKSLRSSTEDVAEIMSAGTDCIEEIEHFVESPQSSQLQSRTSRCKNDIAKENAQIREFFTMKCEICHDRFDTFAKVSKHYRTVHKTEGYLICCGKKISKRCLVIDHMHLHLNPSAFRCDPCGKNFTERRSLKSHIANHESINSQTYKCNLCSKRFTNPSKLTHHELLRHSTEEDKKFQCDICNKRYVLKSLLKDHIRRYHELAFSQVCDICANVFKSKSALKDHMQHKHSTITRPKVQCTECGVWLKHESSLRAHMTQHKGTVATCSICKTVCKNTKLLKSHIHNVHGERSHQCLICNKAFKRARSLKEHMALHTGQDLYKCQYCTKTFKSGANMYSHQKKAHFTEWTRDRSKRLTATSVEYVLKSLLKEHIRRYHVLVFKQVCDICANVFKSKSALKDHMQHKHSTITRPKVQCTECGVWLKHESSLRAHMFQHKSTVATCRICNTVLKNTKSLKSHIHNVHTERSHQCLICNKAFKKARVLKEHMALHTGQDLYKCQYCTKTFKSGANMYSHQKKAHFTEWTRDRSKRLTATSVE